MVRVPTPDKTFDGMSLVTLMPFPALNPLNWWALATPTNAMRAGLHTTKLALDAWRASADGARAVFRAQQDAAIALADSLAAQSLPETTEAAATADGDVREAEAGAEPAALFVQPILEVTRAYGRVGKAFIVAQRDTMRAFADAGRPN